MKYSGSRLSGTGKRLADEYQSSLDTKMEQIELSTSCKKSPAQRSISTPIDQALARRDSFLRYQRPECLSMCNKVYNDGAHNDKVVSVVQEGGKILSRFSFFIMH